MAQARKANVPKTIDCPYSEGVKITFLSAMDIDKRGELYDFLSSLPEKRTTKDQISFYRLVLKKALTGCENVLNEDSIPLSINGEGATDKVLDTLQEVLLPGSGYENLLSWAGSEVWKAATLSEETKKKLRLVLIAQINGLCDEGIDPYIEERPGVGQWYTREELGRLISEHAEILQIANLIECQMMHFDLDKYGTYPGVFIDTVNFIISTKQELSKPKD